MHGDRVLEFLRQDLCLIHCRIHIKYKLLSKFWDVSLPVNDSESC